MCDGVPLDPHRRRRGHAALRLQRGDDCRRAIAPSTRRLPATRTPSTTRSRPTRRWRSRACCAVSAAAPTPTRAARSTSRCAPGSSPAQIVFTGVGKTTAELAHAIDLGVRTINVESAGEIERVDALSRERQVRTKIAIRINPDVDAKTHPHISTGPEDQQVRHRHRRRPGAVRPRRAAWPASRSSACTRTSARRSPTSTRWRAPPARWWRWRASSPADGTRIEHLDLGGGLGVSYDGSPRARPRRNTPPPCCPSCANRAWRSSSSRDGRSSPPPARSSPASST